MKPFLLINTCGDEAVVALGSADAGVQAEERMPGRRASEALLGAMRRVLGGVAVQDLAGVGVVAGPGSFTGVRVGLAMAKGLCDAGGLGLMALSRLELLASPGEPAVLDGGRGEFFVSGKRIVRELSSGDYVTSEARIAERTGARLVGEPGGAEMLQAVVRRVQAGQWDDAGEVDAQYLRRTDAEIAQDRREGC